MHSWSDWVRNTAGYCLVALTALSGSQAEEFIYRGIYLNPYRAADPRYLERVLEAAEEGLINALVVDVKTDFGYLSYESKIELARRIGAIRPILDLPRFVEKVKARGLRLIARVVLFKDSYLAKYRNYGVRDARTGEIWKDAADNCWVDPYSTEAWEYNIKIAQEVLELGFDEIQFDYIRFPTDGAVEHCFYPHLKKGDKKEDAIVGFLKRARSSITAPIQVDLFGYAAWRVLLLEGQNLARMGEFADCICPMLYPSHFSSDFYREGDEIYRSYWLYHDSVLNARRMLKTPNVRIVPYIQGFNYRSPGFGPEYIYAQIRGALDAGAQGFFIWNAGGEYGAAFEALRWVQKQAR